MKDLYNHLKIVDAIGAVVLAADNTPAAIDLRDGQSAVVDLAVGIGGITFDATNKIEVVLTHSDDNVTYSAVVDADMQGVTGIADGIIKSFVAAHAAAANYQYGYIGGKRYLKILADFSGTHGAGTPIAARVIQGDLRLVPLV
jgi:hypothetical protein